MLEELKTFFAEHCGAEYGCVPDCKGKGCFDYSEGGCMNDRHPMNRMLAEVESERCGV